MAEFLKKKNIIILKNVTKEATWIGPQISRETPDVEEPPPTTLHLVNGMNLLMEHHVLLK